MQLVRMGSWTHKLTLGNPSAVGSVLEQEWALLDGIHMHLDEAIIEA